MHCGKSNTENQLTPYTGMKSLLLYFMGFVLWPRSYAFTKFQSGKTESVRIILNPDFQPNEYEKIVTRRRIVPFYPFIHRIILLLAGRGKRSPGMIFTGDIG